MDWFDREFDLGTPDWLLPALVERLRGTPPRVSERCRAAAPDALTRRPNGKWSIQEHAGHLLDLEGLWLARLDDFDAGAETLTPADLTNRKTHEADHNSRELAAILADFEAQRRTLVQRIERMPAEQAAREILHPRLNRPMTIADLALFIAEHDDHHLARMTGLL